MNGLFRPHHFYRDIDVHFRWEEAHLIATSLIAEFPSEDPFSSLEVL